MQLVICAILLEQGVNASWVSIHMKRGLQFNCTFCSNKFVQFCFHWNSLMLLQNWVGEGGVQSTLFCIFSDCYFISSSNKLKLCHTIKQLYVNNIMPKHGNNAFQKKNYNQFKTGTFSVECAPCMGTLSMSMGYTWPVNKKLGCMHCIMFTLSHIK